MNDPNVVSPGILGFLAFFFLAVALYLLVRNMNGHLRRMRYREEQMAAEKAAAQADGDQAEDQGDGPDEDEDQDQDQDQDRPA